MPRFPVADVTFRTPGPSVQAAGDGLEGAYSAVVHDAPSGGTCKVIIPAISLTQWYTAVCSEAFNASPGDRVLVMFDETKQPWVLSPSGIASPSTINGVTVPLTGSAWITPTLVNSWKNYGSGFEAVAYLKDPLGFVHLKGVVTGGATNTTIFTLPAGFRPGATTDSPAPGVSSTAVFSDVEIHSDGTVVWVGNATVTGMSGITFLAEN